MQLPLHVKSRSGILAVGLLGVMVIFVIQLFIMQVIQHGHYRELAEESQVAKLTIPAKRGKIYMQEGESVVPLVLNEPVYTAFADPHEVKDPGRIVEVMRQVAGGNLLDGFEDELDDKQSRYKVMARGLTRDQAAMIKEEELEGVGLQEGTRRVYPEGGMAGQMLGFVDGEGNGQYGIEAALNDDLKGKNGRLEALTDVRRIPLTIGRDNVQEPAEDGDDLVLTIDRGIQAQVEKVLEEGLKRVEATEGSIIVMDPNDGGVLAMANYPSYEPAKYTEVEDYKLFQNGVVSEPYEAGSVIKTLTTGIGLDTGKIRPDSSYHNTGMVQVADTEIQNAIKTDSLGTTTIQDALHYSLNTGMVYILQQLGDGELNYQARKTIYDYYTKNFLFGKPTGIEQANEAAGTIISPDEEQGGIVRYANMTFGQGMDVTMVQVAAAFSAAINGGVYYQPHLVDGIKEGDDIKRKEPNVVRDNVLSPEASHTLRDMVHKARQDGSIADGDKEGYMIGGKTGTSQIIDPNTGQYTDDDSIGTYLGFGGAEKPEYVIMVQVKDSKLPGYAGTVAAAPLFGELSNWLIDYMKLQPRQ